MGLIAFTARANVSPLIADAIEIGEAPKKNTPMPNDTHETAPTQFVQAGNVQFAYRRFGPAERRLCFSAIILPRIWTTGIRR
jgi:hypothetical protein